jgi:hypothetical protein
VLLVGAGTSDYIGKSVCALLQKNWLCNVEAVPSTDLLTNMEDHVIPIEIIYGSRFRDPEIVRKEWRSWSRLWPVSASQTPDRYPAIKRENGAGISR